jgi:hypothetical protein
MIQNTPIVSSQDTAVFAPFLVCRLFERARRLAYLFFTALLYGRSRTSRWLEREFRAWTGSDKTERIELRRNVRLWRTAPRRF